MHELVELNNLIRDTHANCLQVEDLKDKKSDLTVEEMLEQLMDDQYDDSRLTAEKYKNLIYKLYAFLRHQMYVMV